MDVRPYGLLTSLSVELDTCTVLYIQRSSFEQRKPTLRKLAPACLGSYVVQA